ncbi:uracil-DNA glycosylase [bacterium LRH843]|nr:uracil-DNA glycosylase [bacterium LRH843]
MNVLKNDWNDVIGEEFTKPYYEKLSSFLDEEYATQFVYPARNDLFNALHCSSYTNTRVVILGQDPYHGPDQAHGLSFSVQSGVKIPPSLRNIFKELHADIGCPIPNTGNLVPWAKQGILLLNTVLTVRKGEAASHKGKGWETFTDAVIKALNKRSSPVIFVLWGKQAGMKKELITNAHHYIIEAPHPSPLSARHGFFGSRPFSAINQIIADHGNESINWRLSEMEKEMDR